MTRKNPKQSTHRPTNQAPKNRKNPVRKSNREIEHANLLMSIFVKAPTLTDKQLYDYTLDTAVHITDSRVGFFHMVSDDQKEFILTTWNQAALKGCSATSENHYPVESAGNWADCVRLKRPIFYNDYSRSPNQKGLPKGHFPLKRFASVPILEGDKVRFVFGVGNKKTPYLEKDLLHMQLVANVMQEIIVQRRVKNLADDVASQVRALYAAMNDLVVFHEIVYDDSGRAVDYRILDCNPAFTASTGITRERAVGALASKIYGVQTPPYLDHYAQVVQTGQSKRFEVFFEPLHRHYDIAAVSTGKGTFATVTADITERKEDEKTIENLFSRVEHDNEELRKHDKLKNEFIGIVSHDLRTPLTSITGYLRLLMDPRMGHLDTQQGEFVDLAYKNARRLNNLIANFLDLSVMDTGELKLKTREVQVGHIVLEAFKSLQNLAEAKLIHLTADIPEPGPSLTADPDKLEQVFINLIGNAVKFTPNGGTITVGLKIDTREGRKGLLSWVKDNGPGIPPHDLSRVFDKFYRIDNASTRMVPGTGLGLTICRRIVEAHGGQIWVESQEGQGASFLFFIPFA